MSLVRGTGRACCQNGNSSAKRSTPSLPMLAFPDKSTKRNEEIQAQPAVFQLGGEKTSCETSHKGQPMSKGTKSLQWPCLVVHHAQAFCKPLDTLKLKILCNREKLPKCDSKKTYYILQMHIWSRTSTCHELQWTSLLAIIGIIMTNAWSFPLWKSNTFRLLGLWWELKSRLSRNVFSKNVRNHFSMQRGWDETKHPFLWCVT